MSIPQIQIRQESALLGMDTAPGTLEMRQPRATYEMMTERPKQDIRQPRGELEIDQSRAWDALGRGPILEAMSRIYSQAKNVALQGIARIVENGNRLGDLRYKGNPIADMAGQMAFERFEFDYYGEASYDNVDIRYTAHKPQISAEDGKIHVNVHVNPPEINYIRGRLDIYMKQYQKIEITVPEIDLKM